MFSAVVFLVPAADMQTFLVAAGRSRRGLDNIAFIFVDTLNPLSAFSNRTMIGPFIWTASDLSEQPLSTALQAFMILKCHAQSIVIDDQNLSYKVGQ